jgi:hypothetical protein
MHLTDEAVAYMTHALELSVDRVKSLEEVCPGALATRLAYDSEALLRQWRSWLAVDEGDDRDAGDGLTLAIAELQAMLPKGSTLSIMIPSIQVQSR